MQMTSVAGPVFSLAWDERRRYLIVGGHAVINIFKVDMAEARKLSQQQRSVASGLKDSGVGSGDIPQILRRMYPPMKGPDLCHWDVVKLLDKFTSINDQPVCVAYVPPTNMYWASGRFGRLVAYDPRAPSNVTEYVRDSNSLDRFRVTTLFAPLHTDLLLGATAKRQLVVWQHNKQAAYRQVFIGMNHADEVEDARPPAQEEIFSGGADGKVLRWQLDAEENCDIYVCVEEIPLHNKNILAIAYSPELGCLITGGEDSTIQVKYLNQAVPTFNDMPLPTSFVDHELRVTGLALLKHNVLASISADRCLRTWDLTTMKPLGCVQAAHDTPLQCIEYCQESNEIATCGMGNKVKIWDAQRPAALRLKLVLNHGFTLPNLFMQLLPTMALPP
ncbi:uncharacterized protein HaLaN_01062 [Haematococcus lacustris]|uniref:Uncharacterized protein n=1 Tax=Haematococcus lacustris TaxID=44745 RepID=A0A699YTP6_HAELA|nr:uncharacterized protein HaLaN_01062 [Haematococcus lacustris]